MTTAAAIIIGDEILSGKVRDANVPVLIDLLKDQGVELRRVVFIGDTVEEIAREVLFCAETYDAVITTGGVGPTHDDVTIVGVASAFGLGVESQPELEQMIRTWWGDRFTEGALRMAEVPESSRLLYSGDGLMPLVVCKNVYLFPGIPRLFAAKLGALRQELEGIPKKLASLYLNVDESAVAPLLRAVDEAMPEVKIGSYPRYEDEDHRVWVTIEASEHELVEETLTRLLEVLPKEDVVRIER